MARSLPDVKALIAGAVVDQGQRCGKEACRCATGELHGPYTYVVLPRKAGRTRTVYVPAAAAEAVRRGGGAVDASARRPGGDLGDQHRAVVPRGAGLNGLVAEAVAVVANMAAAALRATMRGAEKITAGHRERTAIVYIRQSSLAQVRDESESTARQYALADEAVRLGWARQAGGGDQRRSRSVGPLGGPPPGVQGPGRACVGEVGAIFGLEVSRLARSSADLSACWSWPA